MSGAKQKSRDAARGDQADKPTSDATPSIHSSGLYDLQQIKRFLDDEVISFMESKGYVESTAVSIIKLIFGTIAVVAAVYSHFGVKDFAASRQIVLACVVTYIGCSLLISIASLVFESSAMFVGKLTSLHKRISKGLPQRVWVHTTLGGKGSSTFKVQIRQSVRGKTDASEGSTQYEEYFSDKGFFLRQKFTGYMQGILDGTTTTSSKKKQ